MKRASIALLALLVASCATPPPPAAQGPNAPAESRPAQARSTVDQTATAIGQQAPVESFKLQAPGPMPLFNATATGSATGSSAANAIDGNTATRWNTSLAAASPSLTMEINRPTAVKLLTLTINSTAFPLGTTFNVQLGTAAAGPFTTVLANQTKGAGSVTLNIPASAADAKFVRLVCNNRTNARNRVSFGIIEVNATGDDGSVTPGPVGVTGNFNYQNMGGDVPQYRPNVPRLRWEGSGVAGDPANTAMVAFQTEALAAAPTHHYVGHGALFRSGPNGANGSLLGRVEGEMTQPVDEPVLVFVDPVTNNVVEIIWPAVEGVPGEPIVRVELGSGVPNNLDNVPINAEFTIEKFDENDVLIASWTGRVTDTTVPVSQR